MARKVLKAMRFEEIERLINQGYSNKVISKSLNCSRNTVKKIREGEIVHPNELKVLQYPPWALNLDWEAIKKEFGLGYPLKFIWGERAADIISYSVFWKFFFKKCPALKQGSVTHKIYIPGEQCEVDWAGDKILLINPKFKTERKISVFVGILCFSQVIYANACENEKSINFLDSHRSMFEYFGGIPKVIVPDCLKTGVTKTHIYDPDINTSYAELLKHYNTATVPARPRKPKDKALVENAVRLIMRAFKWKFRNHKFLSFSEINEALLEVVNEINTKKHSKFKVSRFERFHEREKNQLQELPKDPYEYIEWKEAKVHPDCHTSIHGNYYSAPHIYRGQTVRVKIRKKQIEIFMNLERVAIHNRSKDKFCTYITDINHLPDNSKAYHEATPKNLLCQAKYINKSLHELLDGMFQENTIAHIRRAQGFIREAKKEINHSGEKKGGENIEKTCDMMVRFNKVRVPYFKQLLKHFKKEKIIIEDREIQRIPNNPMLRVIKDNLKKEDK